MENENLEISRHNLLEDDKYDEILPPAITLTYQKSSNNI